MRAELLELLAEGNGKAWATMMGTGGPEGWRSSGSDEADRMGRTAFLGFGLRLPMPMGRASSKPHKPNDKRRQCADGKKDLKALGVLTSGVAPRESTPDSSGRGTSLQFACDAVELLDLAFTPGR